LIVRAHRIVALGVVVAILGAVAAPAAGQETTTTARPKPVDARVVGRVVDGEGAALGEVPVIVRFTDDGAGFGDLFLFGAFVAFSGGFGLAACFFPGGCPLGDTRTEGVVANTATAADGGYAATLPQSYVAGHETDTDWVVGAELPPQPGQSAGPTSSFEFEVNIATQEAPPLPLWTVAPEVEVRGWAVVVDGGGAPRGLQKTGFELVAQYGRLHLDSGRGYLDARLLEVPVGEDPGLVAGATGSSDVRVAHDAGRTIYHQLVRSAVVPIDLVPVPPSRGAPCSGKRRDGAAANVAGAAGCRLTDGDFATPVQPPPPPGDPFDDPFFTDDPNDDTTTTQPDPAETTEAVVELADPMDLGLVVVRGLDAASAVVEASEDGTTWERLTTTEDLTIVDDKAATAEPRGRIRARYVRVSGIPMTGLSEVSAWERTGGDAELPASGAASSGSGKGNGGADGDEDDGSGARLLAVLLIVGVGAAGVRTWRRRSGPDGGRA
jgi:hypothetical protein